MTDKDQTEPTPQTRPSRRFLRLWFAALCVLLGVFVYKLLLSRQAEPQAASQPAEPPDGPLLAVSVWADGEPLPDAKVAVTGPRCQQRARTDDQGLVKVYGCSEGRIVIGVEAPDYVRVERAVFLGDSGMLERVDLEPGERLVGRVVDDSGRPLAGVTLTARMLGPAAARGPSTPWLTLTANDGSFAIETLPAGPLVLDISDGGAHEPTSVTDLSLPSQAVLITVRRTAVMSGKVLGEDGNAVPDARVTLAGSGVWPARVLQTDRAGDFLFSNVPEGVYELRAEHENRVSAPLEGVSVQPGSHAKIDLVLAPGVSLRGRVRAAASGAPLRAEVRVVEEALSGRERTVQSQADGSFEVQGLRALPHRVTLLSPGYVADQRWLTPGANTTIELLRAAAASGKVVDSEGRPIARADIEVKGRSLTGEAVQMFGPIQEAPPLSDASSRSLGSGDNLGVTTGAVPRVPVMPGSAAVSGELGFHSDERGNFLIDGLPPGQFTLTARKPGMSAGRSPQLQLRAGATVSDIVITLPSGVSLRGRVVDARGNNVARVRVDLVSGSDLPRSTTTGADGSFVFESARGDCTLWARPFGAPAAKLSGNAQELAKRELLITLASNVDRLHGRVRDASGQPIESASVRLEALKSHGYAPTVLTADDGTFDFQALPPPPYTLSVEHPDYSPSRKQTVENTRDSVEIRLQRGATLRGVVSDAVSRAPLPAAEVVVTSEGFSRAARTARDGSFELRHLPEGPYRLSVSAESYLPLSQDGQLNSLPESAPLRIELMHAASVSGEVVDSLGRTVWNAQVTFGATPDWSRATRTDHAGRFRLHGVPEGDHVLHARHGTLQGTSGSVVRVVEGADTPGALIRLPGVVDEEVVDDAPAARAQPQRSGPLELVMRGSRVVVEHVAADSSAARAGLQAGDVLLSVDGEPVRSAAQARGMLGRGVARRGPRKLQVRRDQSVLELSFGAR